MIEDKRDTELNNKNYVEKNIEKRVVKPSIISYREVYKIDHLNSTIVLLTDKKIVSDFNKLQREEKVKRGGM